ncbi:hypothetical protein [Pseudomonas sp.]|uniref:hypothetical protein n=1 Tax=Pseudomonas sp. TaxID=306 RepID=UPI00272FA3B3|nr:hypothetical protein [Pseudomonas sp.]MDP2243505.1 hypothetical protein [Pseudomonas sp.]
MNKTIFDIAAIKRLKLETINTLNRQDFRFFITLNFNGVKDDLKAQDLIRKFLNLLNAEVFGKRSSKSVVIACSLEKHKSGNYHLHIISEDPTSRILSESRKLNFNYRNIIKKCWEATDIRMARISISCPDKSSWFKEIYDQEGVIEYILKEFDRGRTDVIQWDLSNFHGDRIL